MHCISLPLSRASFAYFTNDMSYLEWTGSIYHIKHMYIQRFTTVVDWPEIGRLMEVHISAMFYICRYCVLTWRDRVAYVVFTDKSCCVQVACRVQYQSVNIASEDIMNLVNLPVLRSLNLDKHRCIPFHSLVDMVHSVKCF